MLPRLHRAPNRQRYRSYSTHRHLSSSGMSPIRRWGTELTIAIQVGLRLYARKRYVGALWLDDWTMLAAAVCTTLFPVWRGCLESPLTNLAADPAIAILRHNVVLHLAWFWRPLRLLPHVTSHHSLQKWPRTRHLLPPFPRLLTGIGWLTSDSTFRHQKDGQILDMGSCHIPGPRSHLDHRNHQPALRPHREVVGPVSAGDMFLGWSSDGHAIP